MIYSKQYINEIFKKLDGNARYDRAEAILEIFALVYKNRNSKSPEWLNAFIEISTWQSVSLRDGIWTYYEERQAAIIERTSQFLKSDTYTELYQMYSYATHDYSDKSSSEQIEQWIQESEIVDDWIFKNEVQIDKWLKKIILNNKEQIYEHLS